MHERTQQAIARLLFVLCCAAPSCLTLGWITITKSVWYQSRATQRLEATIQNSLGLIVEFEKHLHPAPGRWILSNLTFRHPETLAKVGRVREVHWVSTPEESRMLMEQPEIEAEHLEMFWECIHDEILRRPKQLKHPVSVAANDLTIHSGNQSFTFSDLDASIVNSENASTLSAQLQLADGFNQPPIMLEVLRDRRIFQDHQSQALTTTFTLNTNGTTLPCSSLANFLPLFERIGHSASFSGYLQWQLSLDQWQLNLRGARFESIELDRLFESQSHRLSGTATVQLDRCFISPHKKQSEISGSLLAIQGLIGKNLLQQANEHLKIKLFQTQSWDQFSGDIPYDTLSIGFDINGTQMQLEGMCRNQAGYEGYPNGTAVILNGYPLAQTMNESIESLRLLTAIAPNHSVPVPLSQQTHWLTNLLIPPSRPSSETLTTPPRIRSARLWQGGPAVRQPQ